MKRRAHADAGSATAKVAAPRRILVVEDEFQTAQYVDEILRRMGIQVIGPAGSLRQAMILAETEPLDAALLDVRLQPDVQLPYSDRVYPVADVLRRRKIPFSFVTSSTGPEIDRFPRYPVLRKPFREDELQSAVRRLLRRSLTAAPAASKRRGGRKAVGGEPIGSKQP